MSKFQVKPISGIHLEFFLDFQGAREMYVTARVSLQNGLAHAGLLLAHQSIEIMTKGIMYLDPEHYYCADEEDPLRKGMHRFWGHSLPDLIGKATVHNTKLNEIMRNNDIRTFLTELTNSYTTVRYGEAGYSIETGSTIQDLDKVFEALDNAYLEKCKGIPKTKLRLPRLFHDSFLTDNHAYGNSDTSQSPLANNPGANPSELPAFYPSQVNNTKNPLTT